MARKLTDNDWIDLSLTELTDVPYFEYRQTEMDYIKFSDASAGQQATALIGVLLKEEGPPLIIDQPEEDLDNEVMQEIIKEIGARSRTAKLSYPVTMQISSSMAMRTLLRSAATGALEINLVVALKPREQSTYPKSTRKSQ